MRYTARSIEPGLRRAARQFPALIVTGPRRAGKTTLLRHVFPKASYALLEDPDILARVRADPRGFLDELPGPVVLDEIQNAPELFAYVRTRIDAAPRRTGRWILTGSQEAALMQGITESLAGRAAVFHLPPFSVRESERVSLLLGGFPEVLARPRAVSLWFRSYLQTYLERDVRAVTAIRDLATFRRFLALLASRCGQILNRTELAAPLGVSVPTITQWLSVLEITGQVLLLPPYFENFGKRIVKSPRLHLVDSGLACHLLGITSRAELERSPFLGSLFEGFVASEIVKAQLAAGRAREIYYFRDQQGLEVDLLVPRGGNHVALIEAKTTRTARPEHADALLRLRSAMRGRKVEGYVVHRSSASTPATEALRPGVRAVGIDALLRRLDARPGRD